LLLLLQRGKKKFNDLKKQLIGYHCQCKNCNDKRDVTTEAQSVSNLKAVNRLFHESTSCDKTEQESSVDGPLKFNMLNNVFEPSKGEKVKKVVENSVRKNIQPSIHTYKQNDTADGKFAVSKNKIESSNEEKEKEDLNISVRKSIQQSINTYKKYDTADRIDFYSCCIFPLVYSIFVCVFWFEYIA